MNLLTVILALAALGVILWLVHWCPWIDATIKKIINFIAIAFVVLWLLKGLGLFAYLSEIRF